MADETPYVDRAVVEMLRAVADAEWPWVRPEAIANTLPGVSLRLVRRAVARLEAAGTIERGVYGIQLVKLSDPSGMVGIEQM